MKTKSRLHMLGLWIGLMAVNAIGAGAVRGAENRLPPTMKSQIWQAVSASLADAQRKDYYMLATISEEPLKAGESVEISDGKKGVTLKAQSEDYLVLVDGEAYHLYDCGPNQPVRGYAMLVPVAPRKTPESKVDIDMQKPMVFTIVSPTGEKRPLGKMVELHSGMYPPGVTVRQEALPSLEAYGIDIAAAASIFDYLKVAKDDVRERRVGVAFGPMIDTFPFTSMNSRVIRGACEGMDRRPSRLVTQATVYVEKSKEVPPKPEEEKGKVIGLIVVSVDLASEGNDLKVTVERLMPLPRIQMTKSVPRPKN